MSPGEPGSVSGTVCPMMIMSSKITPGLHGADAERFERTVEAFAQVDAAVLAELWIGLPVLRSSAHRKLRYVKKTRSL